MTKTVFTKLMSAILAGALLTLALLSCGITANAADLMKKIEAPEVSGKPADEKFRVRKQTGKPKTKGNSIRCMGLTSAGSNKMKDR